MRIRIGPESTHPAATAAVVAARTEGMRPERLVPEHRERPEARLRGPLRSRQRSRVLGGRDDVGGATGTLTAKRERWIAKQRNGFSLPLSCSGGSSL